MNGQVDSTQRLVWERPPRPQRIGLALGGGVARGIAHIGVLQVLEEQGIHPHYIAGTSAGALVGGLYAAGVNGTQLHELAGKLKWTMLSSMPVNLNWSALTAMTMPLGLLGLDRMVEWIIRTTSHDLQFDELEIPFAAVATDVTTGETVVMNQGAIGPAIRASCSVPGIFTPVRRDGRLLVDGGASNNLPVSVVAQMGADYVIAVDLLPYADEAQVEPKNILEVSMTSLYILIRASQRDTPMANCVIQPAVGHVSLSDLSAVTPLVAAGRAAAERMVPQILADLGHPQTT
ncbi:MAG: patatin-like phospholipase family protein [Caldilineaceae bacterium]